MDKYRKDYLVGKLERNAAEMAEILKAIRNEEGASRLVRLQLVLLAHGRGVQCAMTVDGQPNLPGVGELEQELGLVEGSEGPERA